MNTFLIILLSVLSVILVWLIFVYNALISGRNRIKNAEAGIDAQLQKRYDLIPNLVATVKGYTAHEKSVLEQITYLRQQALKDEKATQKEQIDTALNTSLKYIFAISENYPVLKADANFLQLQAALNEVEAQLTAARRTYNATVTRYNNWVESFPSSLVASSFGFTVHHWFTNTSEAQQNPQIVGKL